MRRLAGICIVLVLAVAAVSPLGTAAGTTEERARVVQLVNEERARNGLASVAENSALTKAAEGYALSMATLNFFSHTGADGSTVSSRAEAAGYTGWTWLGENIAAGQTSPDAVFQAWMNSPGHRANILSPSAREIGIGHAYAGSSRYKHYWTMELGSRPGAAQAPTPVPTAVPTATPQPRPVAPAGAYRVVIPLGTR